MLGTNFRHVDSWRVRTSLSDSLSSKTFSASHSFACSCVTKNSLTENVKPPWHSWSISVHLIVSFVTVWTCERRVVRGFLKVGWVIWSILTNFLCLYCLSWKYPPSLLTHCHTPSAPPPLLQYQAWWKDRYGKNSFNDDEEVENLLTKKSNSSSNTIRSSIAPTLGFWNEIASVSFIFPEVKQPAEDCGVSSRTIKPAEARPENCCRCRSCWETFFIDMIRRLSSWLSSHVMGGGFLCHYLCPLRHVMSLPLTVKTTCKGSQAWHQGNMYIQSTVWTHI